MANVFDDNLDLSVLNGITTSPLSAIYALGPNADQSYIDDLNNLAYTQLLERGVELDSFGSHQDNHPSLKGWLPQWGPAYWDKDPSSPTFNKLRQSQPTTPMGVDIWGNNSYIPKQTFHQQTATGDIYDKNPNAGIRFMPKGSTNKNDAYAYYKKGVGVSDAQAKAEAAIINNASAAFSNATGLNMSSLFQGQPTQFTQFRNMGLPSSQVDKQGNPMRAFENPYGKQLIDETNSSNRVNLPIGAAAAVGVENFKESPDHGNMNYVMYDKKYSTNPNVLTRVQNHELGHIFDRMLARSSDYGYVRSRGNTTPFYSYGSERDLPFTGSNVARHGTKWLDDYSQGYDRSSAAHAKAPGALLNNPTNRGYDHYYDKLNNAESNSFMNPKTRSASSKAYASLFVDKRHQAANMYRQAKLMNRAINPMTRAEAENYVYSNNEQGAHALAEFERLLSLTPADRAKAFKRTNKMTPSTAKMSEGVFNNFVNMFKVMNKGTYGFN